MVEKQNVKEDFGDFSDALSDRQFSRNLARGLEVLRCFNADDIALSNSEICRRTGLAKATVSRLTYTLVLLGYLISSPKTQKFCLGPSILSLSHPLLARLRIRQIIRPHMEWLARQTNCTVNLGLRDRLNVIYIDSCKEDKANTKNPDIGSARPLLLTAMGRALILSSPKAEQTAMLNYLRISDSETFNAASDLYKADMKLFREKGYCISRGDWQDHIHAVAVPIYRTPDGISIALNCTTYTTNHADNKIEEKIAPLLLKAALKISEMF